ncbi:hypothetical protein ACQY0O_005565 [Thecaphora frezii]
MRIAFCVLLVLALLAFAAPSHAMDFNKMASTFTYEIDQVRERLFPLLEGPAKQKKPSVFDSSKFRRKKPERNELEVLQLRKKTKTSRAFELLSLELRNAERVVIQVQGRSYLRQMTAIDSLKRRVDRAEKSGLAKAELERSDPLSSAYDGLQLGSKRLKQFEEGIYETSNLRKEAWNEILNHLPKAEADIATVKARVALLQKSSQMLREAIDTAQRDLSEHQEDEVFKTNLLKHITFLGIKLDALEKVISWHNDDINKLKKDVQVYQTKAVGLVVDFQLSTRTFPILQEPLRVKMRIAFGVLVVVALLALAAPIAAKIPTEAATQELNEAHNQLIRIVDKPTAWDKIRHRLRKSNPSTVKALRLPQQRPEPSEDIQKALQNLQTAEDTMTKANNEKNRYVREWALQPFDTLIHWNTNDAKTVKDALQKVRNAAYKAFPMDARNQRSNDGKEVAQAQA